MGCTLLAVPSIARSVGCTRFLPDDEGAESADALSRVAGVEEAGWVGESGVAATSNSTGGRGEQSGADAATALEGKRPKDSATDAGAAFVTATHGADNRVGAMRFFLGGSVAVGQSRMAFSSKEGGSSTLKTSDAAVAQATGDSQDLERLVECGAIGSVAEASPLSTGTRGVTAVALAGMLCGRMMSFLTTSPSSPAAKEMIVQNPSREEAMSQRPSCDQARSVTEK